MAVRLSKPISSIQEEYDVVVVGSGYGGAIAASRLARAGRRVCLLERGREWLPGDFPKTLDEVAPEGQVRKHGEVVGRRDGLYEQNRNQGEPPVVVGVQGAASDDADADGVADGFVDAGEGHGVGVFHARRHPAGEDDALAAGEFGAEDGRVAGADLTGAGKGFHDAAALNLVIVLADDPVLGRDVGVSEKGE